MKLIALPDLHGGLAPLAKMGAVLAAADLILLVGDLTNGGGTAEAWLVVETVRRFNPAVLAVPGNWDDASVDRYLTGLGINLHRRAVTFQGVTFVGVGGSLPTPGHTLNEISEADFERCLAEATAGLKAGQPAVLICHEPPIDTRFDLTWSGLHVGSRSIRAVIERIQPALCCTGHIHEGSGVELLGSTWVLNPGLLWEGHYGYAELVAGEVRVAEVREI